MSGRKQAGATLLPLPLIRAGDWDAIDWKFSWRLKALALAAELSGSPLGRGDVWGGGCVCMLRLRLARARGQSNGWQTQNWALRFTGLHMHKPELSTRPDAAHLRIPHKSYAPGLIFWPLRPRALT